MGWKVSIPNGTTPLDNIVVARAGHIRRPFLPSCEDKLKGRGDNGMNIPLSFGLLSKLSGDGVPLSGATAMIVYGVAILLLTRAVLIPFTAPF